MTDPTFSVTTIDGNAISVRRDAFSRLYVNNQRVWAVSTLQIGVGLATMDQVYIITASNYQTITNQETQEL
ncbi:MAG: hypothetical protein M3R24_41630 [Chloroflexota bacterium]|nr:hypothetical protein [Chloroflexota bacterium]